MAAKKKVAKKKVVKKTSSALVKAFAGLKIDGEIKMDITQNDIIDVHVSEFEEALRQKQEELSVAGTQLYEEARNHGEDIKKQCRELVRSEYNSKLKHIGTLLEEILLTVPKDIKIIISSDGLIDKGGKVEAHVAPTFEEHGHGHHGRGHHIAIRTGPSFGDWPGNHYGCYSDALALKPLEPNDKIKELVKKGKEIKERKEQNDKESEEVRHKLNNLSFEIRKVKAYMTKKLLKAKGIKLEDLLPETAQIS